MLQTMFFLEDWDIFGGRFEILVLGVGGGEPAEPSQGARHLWDVPHLLYKQIRLDYIRWFRTD